MGLPFPSGVAILGFDVLRAFTKKLWRNSDANMGRDMIYLLEEETVSLTWVGEVKGRVWQR